MSTKPHIEISLGCDSTSSMLCEFPNPPQRMRLALGFQLGLNWLDCLCSQWTVQRLGLLAGPGYRSQFPILTINSVSSLGLLLREDDGYN